MKKFLSMLLTLILVLNVFVGTGIFAFATEGSEGCTHTDGGDNYNNICDDCKEYVGTDELVVGENSVMMTDYNYSERTLIKFVPAESGDYYFYSTMSENDPRALLFDSDLCQLVYNDDGKGYPNFGFIYQLEAGKTYYLAVVTYNEIIECSVVIEKHVHSGGEETCMGMLCECGEYYGEMTYEHRLDSAVNCSGRKCMDCEKYFGESVGEHFDGDDEYINLCDVCEQYYMGNVSAKEGENTVSLIVGQYVYISFVPSASGLYNIYSTEDTDLDPDLYIFDANWKELTIDTYIGAFNVGLELAAGETYYLRLKEFENDNDLTYYIESHLSHSDGKDNYNNLCDICYEFLGKDLVLGSSNVNAYDDNKEFYRFIPSESGKYIMVSVNSEDTCVELRQMIEGSFEYMDEADDNYSLTCRDFYLKMELVAGSEYYFGFSSYEDEGSFEIRFIRHEECVNTVAMCNGNYCTVCGEYVSETDSEGEHVWYFGECKLCYEYIPEDYDHEHKYSWAYCIICNGYIPQDYTHEHDWDEGDCRICAGGHDCQVNDWDEFGYCKVCDEDAGFKIIRGDKITYYKGLTATIKDMQDGDLVVMLENRVIDQDYRIDADVTIDFNGHRLRYNEEHAPSVIYVFGNVMFMDSSNGDARVYPYIYVHDDATFVSGNYSYIELYNDKSFADVIVGCSDVYQYDENSNNLVDISEYKLNYAYYFEIISNEEKHEAYQVVTDETCISDKVIDDYCVYCEKHLDTTVFENTATGHTWHGIYGEGAKECAGCGLKQNSTIYSGKFARMAVRNLANNVTNNVSGEDVLNVTVDILTVAGELLWELYTYVLAEVTE